MRIVFFIYITVILSACHASRQAGLSTPEIILNPIYRIEFTRSILVPSTIATKQIDFLESDLDIGLEIQLKNAKVELKRLRLENKSILDVKVTTEPQVINVTDTIYAQNYIVEDSTKLEIYQIINKDTTLLATVHKPEKYFPAPKPPTTIAGIIMMAISFIYGLVTFLKNRKKRKGIS